jgi:hypothetical protein
MTLVDYWHVIVIVMLACVFPFGTGTHGNASS